MRRVIASCVTVLSSDPGFASRVGVSQPARRAIRCWVSGLWATTVHRPYTCTFDLSKSKLGAGPCLPGSRATPVENKRVCEENARKSQFFQHLLQVAAH